MLLVKMGGEIERFILNDGERNDAIFQYPLESPQVVEIEIAIFLRSLGGQNLSFGHEALDAAIF